MPILIRKLNINEIGDAELRTAYFVMSAERQKKCDGYKFAKDKKLCICADMLVRNVLKSEYLLNDADIDFFTSPNGKPFLRNSNIFFNVSHSYDYVVAAFSDRGVGIDVEHIKPVKSGLMRHFCSDNDILYIVGQKEPIDIPILIEDESTLKRFFEVWTFKEAYVKRSGIGLNDDILNISFIENDKFIEFFDGYVLCAV